MQIQSLYRIFFFTVMCIFISRCTGERLSHLENHDIETYINAPKGSSITPYIHNINSDARHYKVFLAQNNGEHRKSTETAMIIVPLEQNHIRKISFELVGDDSLISLKTPLTLIDITDKNNQSLLSLHLNHNIYWLESQGNHKKVPLFLEQTPQKFVIHDNQKIITLTFGATRYQIPVSSNDNTIKIGLMRSDLLRYRGLVLPKQKLKINNMHIYDK